MLQIEFKQACIRFNDSFSLLDIDWTLGAGQTWAILGGSGSGKSALAAAVAGAGQLTSGSVAGTDKNAGIVSLEAQAALIERERLRDDSDITDRVNAGTPVRDMLDEVCVDPDLQATLIRLFRLEDLLDRGFRKLSTGETRKVLLTRVLTSRPPLMIVDGPFEGLDAQTVPLVEEILRQISAETPLLLVINRFDEIPGFVTHLAFLEKGSLKITAETRDRPTMSLLSRLSHLKTSDIKIPDLVPGAKPPALKSGAPLVAIRKACVSYTGNTVFENLDWRIEPGQHWQLTGPNGSGKTCLLNLITGDHPQCYSNDIFVCGYQRGQGESIWDVKRHIGHVSSALQWDYRVGTSCRNVIISGFHDSIGLYSRPTEQERQTARQWLRVLGLQDYADRPFNQCSYSEQRLLLIARAMVKHPHLLILDEPCFGLDDLSRQLVLALIEKICAGTESTVIYVNHHAQDSIEGIEHHLALGGERGRG
ncbi:MAG: molybdate ABC transporter ATP-binding protein ModF [Gammaproteobacteria bacterium]|nr:molybdate ABC transporter ATP-binding protein ModF [Gammaproteobacteria bacterium]MBT8076759.1 molybdate ABC transporter ATP-binding protein ModF [Gammaproteobacteria bacterium]